MAVIETSKLSTANLACCNLAEDGAGNNCRNRPGQTHLACFLPRGSC